MLFLSVFHFHSVKYFDICRSTLIKDKKSKIHHTAPIVYSASKVSTDEGKTSIRSQNADDKKRNVSRRLLNEFDYYKDAEINSNEKIVDENEIRKLKQRLIFASTTYPILNKEADAPSEFDVVPVERLSQRYIHAIVTIGTGNFTCAIPVLAKGQL